MLIEHLILEYSTNLTKKISYIIQPDIDIWKRPACFGGRVVDEAI